MINVRRSCEYTQQNKRQDDGDIRELAQEVRVGAVYALQSEIMAIVQTYFIMQKIHNGEGDMA